MAGTAVIYDLIARDSASTVFNRVGRSADGMNSKMAKVAKVAEGAGLALVGLGAGIAEAADKAAEFQSSMTKIQTMAGGTAKDVASLSKQVLSLATTTQQGPQALSEALYHLKSVGMDNVQAMKALKEGSDLAAVGGANLEETVNALAGAWRTGIKGATSFHDTVSTVNAIIGAGNMTMDQFNAAIGTGILPSAKTFGLSMGQVGAALALMTDEGIDSASAATRLRMSFSLLGAPSKAAEKQLGQIGLTGLQLADAMRGPNGIIGAIQLLKDHLDASGLSASQQSQILSRAFGGGRSSSGILLMINNLDVLKRKQDQVNRSTGKFDDAVKTQRKTAEAQWKLLTSNLESLTITMGAKLLPPITSFVKDINTKAIPAASRLGGYLAKLVPIDRIKHDFATVTSMVGDFLSGLKGTKAPAVKLDGSSFLTKPPGAVLPPLAAPKVKPIPSDAFQLSKNAALPPLLPPKPSPSEAKQAGQRLSAILTASVGGMDWSKLGAKIGTLLEKAIGWVGSHAKELSGKVSAAIQKIDWVDVGKGLGNMAIPLAIGFIDNLFAPLFTGDFWKKHWLDALIATISVIPIGKAGDAVGALLKKIPWGKLGELIAKGWDKIPWGKIFTLGDKINWASIFTIGGRINWSKVLTLGDIGPASVRWAGRILGKIRDGFTSNFPRLTQWLSDQWVLLPTRLGDLGRALNNKVSKAFSDLGGWITSHVPGMGNKLVRGLVKAIGRFSFYQTGINLVVGLYNGITDKLAGAYTWVKTNWVDPFVGWVKGLFGVHSPSTVFAEIGGWLVSGLLSGISAGVKGLGTWVSVHMVSPVTSRFSGAGSWLVGRGSAAVSGLKLGVVAGAKGLGGWVSAHVVSPVTSRFAGAGTWLLSRGSQVVSGLKNGVTSGAKAIGSWAFSHVAQPLTSRFSAASTWLPGRGSQLISGLKSGITGAMKGIGSWVKSRIVDPVVNAVKHYFGIHSPSTVFASLGGHLTAGLLKGMAQTGGTAIARRVFGSLPSALASIVGKGLVHITSLPGKAMSALAGLGGKLGSLLGGIFGGGGGKGGVGQWAGDVSAVLAMLGAPSSALSAVLTRIGIESGGNPKAINLWDSNAIAGHPSQGLMQTIPSTFNAYAGPFKSRGITDPLASIYAGVNYAMHRYGKNWINVMTRPGGYDQGGLANHKGVMLKNTNRPERVLSPRQTVAFEQLVAALGRISTGGAGGDAERPIHVHVHVDDAALKDLIRVEVDCGLDELGTALGVTA